MPTLERVKELHKELTGDAFALIDKKGHDYNKDQQNNGDTLYNLRVAHLVGLVDSPQASVMVRICDKLMRMISLRNPTTAAEVKDESVRDTVRDLINYAVYYYAFYDEQKEKLQK